MSDSENDTRIPTPAPPPAAPNAVAALAEAIDRLAAVLTESFSHQHAMLDSGFGRLERKVDALTALIATPQQVHAVEPQPDQELNPVFDSSGFEIVNYGKDAPLDASDYPLTATCRCCRQITKMDPGSPWAHCD